MHLSFVERTFKTLPSCYFEIASTTFFYRENTEFHWNLKSISPATYFPTCSLDLGTFQSSIPLTFPLCFSWWSLCDCRVAVHWANHCSFWDSWIVQDTGGAQHTCSTWEQTASSGYCFKSWVRGAVLGLSGETEPVECVHVHTCEHTHTSTSTHTHTKIFMVKNLHTQLSRLPSWKPSVMLQVGSSLKTAGRRPRTAQVLGWVQRQTDAEQGGPRILDEVQGSSPLLEAD